MLGTLFLTRAHTADLLYIYAYRILLKPNSVRVVCYFPFSYLCVCVCVCAQLLTSEGKVVETEAVYAEQPPRRRAV